MKKQLLSILAIITLFSSLHGISDVHKKKLIDKAFRAACIQSTSNDRYESLFEWAAEKGYIGLLRLLVDDKLVDLKKVAETKFPLHLAVIHDKHEVVAFLLEHNFYIDSRDTIGKTPLMWAVRFSHFNLINFLLENGASLRFVDNDGFNAIDLAVLYGREKIAEHLFEKERNLNKKDTEN